MHREGEPWTGSCDQCWRSPGDRGQSGTALYLGNVWIATADGPSSTRAGPLPRHHYQQQPHLRWSPRWEADHHRCEKSLRDTMKEMPSMGLKLNRSFIKRSHEKKQSGCLNFVCTCTHVMIKHLLSPLR